MAAGWSLSLLQALTAVGYAVVLPLAVAGLMWLWRGEKREASSSRRSWLQIPVRRFRRPLPLIFFIVAALTIIGGTLYAPSNFDALTYRLPRILNWWAAGQWHWIPTFNERMNFSGTVWEWLSMPFLIFTRSDRGMFLINALGFLLMPGLLFSIFRHLGVARKVAWTWMWLLPLGYGFATQAGSIGNDLTGAVFCLLSVYFGLRARRSGRVSEVWLALLAAALMTGVKLSNLPLALPCLVAVWPALGQLRKCLLGSLAVAVLAVAISAVPIMALNQLHTGNWTGDPGNQTLVQIQNPVAGVLGNGFLLLESFMPPVLPFSNQINHGLTAALPDSLKKQFPRLVSNKINELPGEEGAGLGLGIALPLLIVFGISACRFRRAGFIKKVSSLLPLVALAAWVSVLFVMAKMGSEAGPRLLLPYYSLAIVPFLLLPAQERLLRRRAWRAFLVLTALGVLPVLVLSVSRPLWPAQKISGWLARTHPENKMFARLAATDTIYAHRNDFLAPIRAALPDTARTVGFIAGPDDADYSLWRPFGRRNVVYPRHDLRQFLENPDVEWLVVKENVWPEISSVPLKEWAQAHQAKIVLSVPIVELVSWGAENWCLLHIEKPDSPAATRAN
ncbi:MAG TPA: hypothetical protein VIK53_18650 [Verrucomicrobiae bacterium]